LKYLIVVVIEVGLNTEKEQNWVSLPHRRALAICVCPVLSCSNHHDPEKIRKLKEPAVRGRDPRGFVLCSAGLTL
jgi:hypothetical protein